VALTKDLTLLLGIEATQNIVEQFGLANEQIQKLRNYFGLAGDAAEQSGTIMTTALKDVEVAGGLANVKQQELITAQERLNAVTAEFKTISEQAAKGDITAKEAQIAKSKEYMATLQMVNKAELDAAAATKVHTDAVTAQAAAEGVGGGATTIDRLNAIGPKAAIVTAAIIGIGYESAKAAAEYQQSVIKIANSANLPMEAADKIGQSFLNMSESSIFSAQTIASSYGSVAGQLSTLTHHTLTAKDAVDFMKVAAEGAAASGQPLATVTTNLAKIMQQYQLSVKDAANAEGYLYNVGRLTGQGMSAVTMQITRMKGQLGILAPSIKDTTSLMLDMTEHGMNPKRSSQALNSMLNTLLKTGRATVPTMGEINNAIKSLPPSLQAMATAYTHGSMSAAAFDAQIKTYSKTSPAYAGYLKSIKTLVTQSGESVKTLNALKLTPVQNQLAQLNVKLFDSSGKFIGIKGVIEQVGPKLAAMKDKSEQLRIATILFGTQAKALLPTILAGGAGYDKAAKSIENQRAIQEAARKANSTYEASMTKMHNAITAVRIELGNAFLPIMEKIVAGIGAVLKPVADFVGKNKDLVKVVMEVVGGIGLFVTIMWAGHKVVGATTTAFKNLGNGFKAVMDGFKKIVGKITEQITMNEALVVSNGEVVAAQDAMAANTAIVDTALGGETIAAGAAETANVGLAASIWAVTWPILAVIAVIALIVLAVYELVKHWKTVWGVIKTVAKDVADFFVRIWDDAWKLLKPIFDLIVAIVKIAMVALGILLLPLIATIALIVVGIKLLWEVWKKIWEAIGPSVEKAVGTVLNALGKILSFFGSLGKKILGFLGGILSDMVSFGTNIIESIAKGISSAASKVWDAFKTVLNKIPGLNTVVNFVGKLWPFHTGGVVQGYPGQEVPALLQAGETVLTPNQMQNLTNKKVVSPVYSSTGGSKGGITIVNVNVSGAVYGSLNDFSNALGKHLNSTVLPQAGVVLTH
jgi:hypothetical protein